LSFFLVGQLSLSLALETIAPGLRARDYAYKREWLASLQKQHPNRPLVLMVGSSRTLGGFQASRLHDLPGPDGKPVTAFNFGLILTGPIKENLLVRTLSEEGVRPRLLLVEVLPPFLSAPGEERQGEESWLEVETLTLPQLAQLWSYCEQPGKLGRRWLWSRVLPAYHHRVRLLDSVLRSWQAPPIQPKATRLIDRWGWSCGAGQRVVTPASSWKWTSTAYYFFGSPLVYFRLGAGPTQALRDLLGHCRQEGIAVALVLMPEGSQFRSWYPAQAREAIDGLMKDLAREEHVEVIDARTWVPDHGFWDSHHMLPHGAKIFTGRLIPEVQRLLKQTDPTRAP
jgi:hypothetical protein